MPNKSECSNRERKKESGKKNKEKVIYSSKHVRQVESKLIKQLKKWFILETIGIFFRV